MNPLPAPALTSTPIAIADLLSKPLPRHRFTTLIGDILSSLLLRLRSSHPQLSPLLQLLLPIRFLPLSIQIRYFVLAATPPIVLDTGASFSIIPSASDFLSVTQAPYGLIRTPTSVVSNTKVSSKATLSNDPYTLITGEDTATTIDFDLSSPDLFDLDSDSVDTFKFASAFEVLEFREFGTATLIFISDPHTDRKTILVEPTLDRFDWLDWIPLPRLILPKSYFHIFGLDYLQAFALFHLIPIWIALVFALLRSE